MSLTEDVYLRNAKTFTKSGAEMIEAVDMARLKQTRDWQLLADAAGQLEQAAREIRRLEGALTENERHHKAAP